MHTPLERRDAHFKGNLQIIWSNRRYPICTIDWDPFSDAIRANFKRVPWVSHAPLHNPLDVSNENQLLLIGFVHSVIRTARRPYGMMQHTFRNVFCVQIIIIVHVFFKTMPICDNFHIVRTKSGFPTLKGMRRTICSRWIRLNGMQFAEYKMHSLFN